jgi:Domain of unknown function (DUF4158)
VNFRNYLLRICSSWASPERTQGSPFHDSGSYSFSNHSRSWAILSASQRFRLPCLAHRQDNRLEPDTGRLIRLNAITARFRHMDLVRFYLGVTPFADTARKLMLRTSLASSRVREDLADIVNMAIEELIRQRYELPGFSTLFRAARAARVTVSRLLPSDLSSNRLGYSRSHRRAFRKRFS